VSEACDSVIAQLRRQASFAADQVLRRNGALAAGLSAEDRLRLERLAHAVAERLLEDAEARLERLERQAADVDVAAAVRELFALGEAA
jgi:hypothetical protein